MPTNETFLLEIRNEVPSISVADAATRKYSERLAQKRRPEKVEQHAKRHHHFVFRGVTLTFGSDTPLHAIYKRIGAPYQIYTNEKYRGNGGKRILLVVKQICSACVFHRAVWRQYVLSRC